MIVAVLLLTVAMWLELAGATSIVGSRTSSVPLPGSASTRTSSVPRHTSLSTVPESTPYGVLLEPIVASTQERQTSVTLAQRNTHSLSVWIQTNTVALGTATLTGAPEPTTRVLGDKIKSSGMTAIPSLHTTFTTPGQARTFSVPIVERQTSSVSVQETALSTESVVSSVFLDPILASTVERKTLPSFEVLETTSYHIVFPEPTTSTIFDRQTPSLLATDLIDPVASSIFENHSPTILLQQTSSSVAVEGSIIVEGQTWSASSLPGSLQETSPFTSILNPASSSAIFDSQTSSLNVKETSPSIHFSESTTYSVFDRRAATFMFQENSASLAVEDSTSPIVGSQTSAVTLQKTTLSAVPFKHGTSSKLDSPMSVFLSTDLIKSTIVSLFDSRTSSIAVRETTLLTNLLNSTASSISEAEMSSFEVQETTSSTIHFEPTSVLLVLSQSSANELQEITSSPLLSEPASTFLFDSQTSIAVQETTLSTNLLNPTASSISEAEMSSFEEEETTSSTVQFEPTSVLLVLSQSSANELQEITPSPLLSDPASTFLFASQTSSIAVRETTLSTTLLNPTASSISEAEMSSFEVQETVSSTVHFEPTLVLLVLSQSSAANELQEITSSSLFLESTSTFLFESQTSSLAVWKTLPLTILLEPNLASIVGSETSLLDFQEITSSTDWLDPTASAIEVQVSSSAVQETMSSPALLKPTSTNIAGSQTSTNLISAIAESQTVAITTSLALEASLSEPTFSLKFTSTSIASSQTLTNMIVQTSPSAVVQNSTTGTVVYQTTVVMMQETLTSVLPTMTRPADSSAIPHPEIAPHPTPSVLCSPPCGIGGTCSSNNTCACQPEFRGDRCEQSGVPPPTDADRDGSPDNVDPCVGCCNSEVQAGILWHQSVQGTRVVKPCSLLHPSFSPGSVFSRICIANTAWTSLDLRSCTFKTGSANPILHHRVRVDLSKTPSFEVVVEEYSRLLRIFGIVNVNVSFVGSLDVIYKYTVDATVFLEFQAKYFNSSLVEAFVGLLAPCIRKRQESTAFTSLEAAGFLPSDSCSCVSDTRLDPLFVPVCSGSAQDPCLCSALGCQCMDPYTSLRVSNGTATGLMCALDSDGDGIADSEDFCPSLYSLDNSCPSVPSENQVACPGQMDGVWGIPWNRTLAGITAGLRCQKLTGGSLVSGSVSRLCREGGIWGLVNISLCQSQDIQGMVAEIVRLGSLSRPLAIFEQQSVESISQEMVNATSTKNAAVLFPVDLQSVNTFMDQVANLIENDDIPVNGSVRIETVLQIASNVLEPEFRSGWTSLNNVSAPNGASQLLSSVDRLASALGSNAALSRSANTFRTDVQLPNLVVSITVLDTTSVTEDEVTIESRQLGGLSSKAAEVHAVTLPRQVLEALGTAVPITTVVFRNLETILPRPVDNRLSLQLPGTSVVSLQVGSNTTAATDRKVSPPISLRFPIIVNDASRPTCVFWNFNRSNNFKTDGWSSEGLTLKSFNSNTVECQSSHLTSFAVLVDVTGQPTPSMPLSGLTYIGCGISSVCLLLTIIFTLSMKKDIYLEVNNFVLLNLCVALMFGLIIFCAGIETATWHVAPCGVVAALLHYFFLAAFGWMLCQSVLVYNLLVKVFGAHQRKWLYIFSAIGWGFPVPVLIISLASRYNFYYIRASLDPASPLFSSIRACWLTTQEGVIFAFLVPMAAIVIINTCLLVRSLFSLRRSKVIVISGKKTTLKEPQAAMEVGIKLVKSTAILIPLVVLTLVFGLLSAIPFPQRGRLVLAALFLVFNTVQGVFIFTFHVIRHDKVWPILKKNVCCCLKTPKETSAPPSGRASFVNDCTHMHGRPLPETKESRSRLSFSHSYTGEPNYYSKVVDTTAQAPAPMPALPLELLPLSARIYDTVRSTEDPKVHGPDSDDGGDSHNGYVVMK